MLPDGTVLAHRYRIRAPLGRGGAAHTYEADDLVEPGKVALKLLDPERPLIALTREFERARRVVHPHLAEVRELAVAEVAGVRRALYTMELVRGGTLGAHVKKVGLRAARIALGDVLAGLHALHRLGLRHGDVKPENVLVRESGRAVLIDLGCAAPLGEARATLSGTPGYLAPELRAGEPADERADLYAFGVMLGALGGAAAGLAPLIAQLTAEAPAARPSSAREVLAALGDPRDLEASSEGRASACHGRAALLARCARALVATTRGEPGPRCVWIEGAPGVGRSRVLRELAFALARDAIDVLDARALGPAPLREALARRHGPAAPGIEGLLDQLVEAGATPGVLALDDAQRIDPDAHAELALAMRGLDARGRLGLLVASTASPPRGVEAAVLHVRLAALDDAAITAWATDVGVVLDGGAGAALARFSGGSPRYLERALGALASGRVVAAQLATLDDALDDASARSLDLALAGLDDDARRALAEAAVRGSVASPPATLFARDLLARREGNAVLAREADRTPLLRRLDARTVRRLQLVAARACVRE
ncbi:MAG: protein kinase, partial [Polyangiales bacterium]